MRVRHCYLRKTKLDVTAQTWSQHARHRGRRIAMKLGQPGLHSEFRPTRGTEWEPLSNRNNIATKMEGNKGKSDMQSPRLRTPYLGGKKRKDSDMQSYGLGRLTPSGWTIGKRQPWLGCPDQSRQEEDSAGPWRWERGSHGEGLVSGFFDLHVIDRFSLVSQRVEESREGAGGCVIRQKWTFSGIRTWQRLERRVDFKLWKGGCLRGRVKAASGRFSI